MDQEDQYDQSGSRNNEEPLRLVRYGSQGINLDRETPPFTEVRTEELRHVASVANPGSRIPLFTSRIQG